MSFHYGHLPDVQKRELCIGLLEEFGVTRIKKTPGGELIHSCCLPGTGHKNGDANASASLNWEKLTYNCFGCGSSGGLLWFIGSCRGVDSDEARDWLGSQTGLGQSVRDLSVLLDLIKKIFAKETYRSPIPRYDPTVLDSWTDWDEHHPYMTHTRGQLIPGTVLRGRGIPGETLDRFRIGYADEYYDGSERIIIPLFWRGELVGWQARALNPALPDKYRNSPDFPRDEVLYNYQAELTEALLVESPLSVLAHAHHLPQTTATFGAKVTEAQIRLLRGYDRVVLWFDNDDAGWQATRTVGDALRRYTRVFVVKSPWAADPADMDDLTAKRLLTEQAVPYSIWRPPTTLTKWTRS